ncbi:hypothetical protein EVAR_48210_1 [Eumeta japonica]|uniref:Uncharacterized protein n=1 Tax=Eumeta variegata TaxID=151549 RepID=A0A4C1XV03_EUMVA|nr:hypothetical protein EVAR_48210_1 [Eumeta japonica]
MCGITKIIFLRLLSPEKRVSSGRAGGGGGVGRAAIGAMFHAPPETVKAAAGPPAPPPGAAEHSAFVCSVITHYSWCHFKSVPDGTQASYTTVDAYAIPNPVSLELSQKSLRVRRLFRDTPMMNNNPRKAVVSTILRKKGSKQSTGSLAFRAASLLGPGAIMRIF